MTREKEAPNFLLCTAEAISCAVEAAMPLRTLQILSPILSLPPRPLLRFRQRMTTRANLLDVGSIIGIIQKDKAVIPA